MVISMVRPYDTQSAQIVFVLVAALLTACSAASTETPANAASVDAVSDLGVTSSADTATTAAADSKTSDDSVNGTPALDITTSADAQTGSAGCGKAPPKLGSAVAGPAWGVNPDHTYKIDVKGTSRSYVLRYPKGYDSAKRYPLVFLFHGTGGSGQEYDYSYTEQAAPEGGAIFVLPSGLDYKWAKANWKGAKKMGWETFNDDSRDLDFFDALWSHVQDEYCVDTTRVFASGHSIGGFMTNYLACARGDVFRAVAPISGGGPDPFFLQNHVCGPGKVAARVIHGVDDKVVPFSFGKESLQHYLKRAGCGSGTVTTKTSQCVRYEGCEGGLPVDLCAFSGVGHSKFNWPKLGPVIWNFFAEF